MDRCKIQMSSLFFLPISFSEWDLLLALGAEERVEIKWACRGSGEVDHRWTSWGSALGQTCASPPRSLHLPQGHCREDSPPRSCHTTYPLSSWAPPGSRLHSLSARSSQNQQPSLSALMTRAKRITLRLTGSLAGSAKCFCRMKASPWEWAAVSSVWRDGGSTAVSK